MQRGIAEAWTSFGGTCFYDAFLSLSKGGLFHERERNTEEKKERALWELEKVLEEGLLFDFCPCVVEDVINILEKII